MIADIATGNTGFADIMFLVAFILGVVAAVLLYPRPSIPPLGHTVLALALSALALGLLVV